jgi:hypothetical protein
MKYKFEQFNVEIDNPTIEVSHVTDSINLKMCNVDVILRTETATFGVNLQGFNYENDWTDAEVLAWVEIELQKYEV